MRRVFIGAAALSLLVAGAVAGAAGRGAASEDLGIDDVAFLAGPWEGSSEGSHLEEHWTEPHAGGMLGMFRWVREDGRPAVFELISIAEEESGTVMRLRHFDALLQPWGAEADGPMVLRLTEAAEGRAVFTAEPQGRVSTMTYERRGDRLSATVAFPEGTGREPLRLAFERAG